MEDERRTASLVGYLQGDGKRNVQIGDEPGQERQGRLLDLLDRADGRSCLVEQSLLIPHLEELAALLDHEGGSLEEGRHRRHPTAEA